MKKLLLVLTFLTLSLSALTGDQKEIYSPEGYEQMSANEKREWIWNNGILPTQYTELPKYKDIKILGLLFTKLSKKMDHMYDFRPNKWKKAIHRRAVVAKVKFVPEAGSEFDGALGKESIGLN